MPGSAGSLPGFLIDATYASTATDYVFACMQANGATRDSLMKRSCSVDAVAAVCPMPNTSPRARSMMRESTNRYRGMFRSYGPFKDKVADLRRAQVEGELRCFSYRRKKRAYISAPYPLRVFAQIGRSNG
jgi:hypothetical protein